MFLIIEKRGRQGEEIGGVDEGYKWRATFLEKREKEEGGRRKREMMIEQMCLQACRALQAAPGAGNARMDNGKKRSDNLSPSLPPEEGWKET